jgi:AcrR family transcriptional regulator
MNPGDLRRERGVRNREALLTAALDLFTSDGYDATTIEQIAARAGVAERTFFHHFPSKEDVLFDGYAERLDEVTRRFRASSPTASLWSALAGASDAVAQAINEQPHRFLERAGLYGEAPALRARMLRINEEWIDSMTNEVARRLGVNPHADVRPRLVATLVNGANRAALEVWVASKGRSDIHELIAESLDLLRPALIRIERGTVVGSRGAG